MILENEKENKSFIELIKQSTNIPEWVNFNSIKQAQNFHGGLLMAIAYVLGISILVGGIIIKKKKQKQKII